MRELTGQKQLPCMEFSNENLSGVLLEAAAWAQEQEKSFITMNVNHFWDEVDGHVLYIWRSK